MNKQSKIKKMSDDDIKLIYQMEGRPSLKVAIPLGLQHVLAMFTGNLSPIFVLSGALGLNQEQFLLLIQCAMFASALSTLVQLYPIKIGKFQIGSGLPIFMGTSFGFVPTMERLAPQYGLAGILGGSILGAFMEIIMGIFLKPLKKYFPPLVIGSVLVTIGIRLLTIGIEYFAGGKNSSDFGSWQNLFIGFTVFVVVIMLQKYGKGMWKVSSILIGLIVGYLIAMPFGKIDFSKIIEAPIFGFPMPLQIIPKFELEPILAFMAVYVVSGLETIGNTSGITMAAFNREASIKETSGAILADAMGSQFANLFNTFPNTAFGQNAGIIAMTKVVNKFCIATGAVILMLCALIPKIGAVFSAIPNSVLGGAVVTVFAMILINGIKLISNAGFSERNILVLGITFGLGYGLGSVPAASAHLPAILQYIFKDSIASVCFFGILANIIFPPGERDILLAKKVELEG